MKNKHIEKRITLAKQYHRNERGSRFSGGIIVRHVYDVDRAEKPSWWDDVTFIQNDYRVHVSWIHPRMKYHDVAEDAAYAAAPDSPEPDWLSAPSTPVHRKLGKSRKKVFAWQMAGIADAWRDYFDAREVEVARILMDSQEIVRPHIKTEWSSHGRVVLICAPIEVHNENDLRALAELVRRLLKGETTLAAEFPGYGYTRDNWAAEHEPAVKGEVENHAPVPGF